jgi:fatty acid desaturase
MVKSSELALWKSSRPELFRRIALERLALYPPLLTLLAVRPLETLLYVLVPVLVGQWGIIAINHVQHVGCDPDSEFAHSRNFTGRFANWWFLNNGYHTAHHARPDVHWSLLPELHERMRPRIRPELERRSLLAAMVDLYLRRVA